ncbi:MAG: hypothetical protein HZC41_18390 [Chloroflexi bacterium]|nr:hypothetical protein [Chloroflexota bacterium]
MSALEQELIDRIRKLDEDRKRQVLLYIQEIDAPRLTLGEWLQDIETLSQTLQAKYGAHHFPSAADLINEVREERLDDILGSL